MSRACFRMNSRLLPISVVTCIFQLLSKPDPVAEPAHCPHHGRQGFDDLQKEICVVRAKAQQDWRPAARATFKLLLAELVKPGDDWVITRMAYSKRGYRRGVHIISSIVQNSPALFRHFGQFDFTRSDIETIGLIESRTQVGIGDRFDAVGRLLAFEQKFL